jgi:hypothetical protein
VSHACAPHPYPSTGIVLLSSVIIALRIEYSHPSSKQTAPVQENEAVEGVATVFCGVETCDWPSTTHYLVVSRTQQFLSKTGWNGTIWSTAAIVHRHTALPLFLFQAVMATRR